jgi:Na+/proline symporter
MGQTAGISITFFYLLAVLLIGYYGFSRTKSDTDITLAAITCHRG